MKHYDVQSRLIDRTIIVIAENGLDKTTTKAIVKGTDINEAYIYRYFSDKEDLLSHVFDTLDEELVAKVLQHLPVMYMRELEYELRCRVFFEAVWKFLLGNKEKCLAFVRYTPTVREKKPTELVIPKANTTMNRVYAYLMNERFIAREVISFFAHERTLYEDEQ